MFMRRTIFTTSALLIVGGLTAIHMRGGQQTSRTLRVIAPATQDNLTIFPVVADTIHDTGGFITLDEGIRSGTVVVTEEGAETGLVRPRPHPPLTPQIWDERVPRARGGAEVNRLVLINNSERPLILLAGEIVTGGKQDRVVGKDRIVPAKSDPVDLSVFCVEPHRWVGATSHFGTMNSFMAQPSVRMKAMAKKDQQQVWDEVAKSRSSVAAAMPAPAAAEMGATSSYAVSMANRAVQSRVEAYAAPLERSYEKMIAELRAQKAVGAVVAVNGEIVWADIFANPSLLEKYWPKLIRSYAAEALSAREYGPAHSVTVKDAQAFISDLAARHENVDSEPGVYRNAELVGPDFHAFVLTSLLRGTGFDVHIAKMEK